MNLLQIKIDKIRFNYDLWLTDAGPLGWSGRRSATREALGHRWLQQSATGVRRAFRRSQGKCADRAGIHHRCAWSLNKLLRRMDDALKLLDVPIGGTQIQQHDLG